MAKNKSISPNSMDSRSPVDTFTWHEKRQRLFIYWCFTHFIHGMLHSIRYSSQYLYFKDVMHVSNPDLLYGMSVSFIGATGVVFPLIISPFIDQSRDIKQVILLVNVLGFIGNLLYAMPFSPVFPLLGQLLAGTTPAFGVIAMGEVSRVYSADKITKRVSALSLVYSVGTFTSIGLVFCFLYVDFYIGAWHITFANMPGLTLSVLFIVSAILSPFLVHDISKEFDLKLEERIKRSSCGSTPRSHLSSAANTPDISRKSSPQNDMYRQVVERLEKTASIEVKKQQDMIIPEIIVPEEEDSEKYKIIKGVGEPYYFDQNKQDGGSPRKLSPPFKFPKFSEGSYERLHNADAAESHENLNSTAKKTVLSIWKILRYPPAVLLMLITFTEGFVYCIIVTCLPVLATRFLNWGKVELAFLSMVNKFLSVVISGSVFFLTDFLNDFLLLTYGTFFSILALLSLSVLTLVADNYNAIVGLLFIIACLAIAGVPLVITSTRSMLAKLVPTEIQSLTEALRLSIFEAAFVPAGFLVPLVTLNITFTALFLLFMLGLSIGYLIHQREMLIDVKEQDEYWSDIATTPSNSPE